MQQNNINSVWALRLARLVFVLILLGSGLLIILLKNVMTGISIAVVTAILLFVLVSWNTKISRFRCNVCNEIFAISKLTNFFSPHTPEKKLLPCPNCQTVSWCTVIISG